MARTALMPTVRRSVLLPDMLEPLTSRTRVSPQMSTSLRTHCAAGMRGWPICSAMKQGRPSRIRERDRRGVRS